MKIISRIDESSNEKGVKVDVKDRKILSFLSENARMPLTKIAKKVRLSRDGVNYRIKRMIDKGIILRFFSIVDLTVFGYYTFHIFVLLDEINQKRQEEMKSYLMKHPNVKSLLEYSDRWDLEISIIARSVQEYDDIVNDISSRFPDIILEKEKLEIIKGYSSMHLPQAFFQKEDDLMHYSHKRMHTKKADDTDLKILSYLSMDAKASTYELSKNMNISHDAIAKRIRELADTEIIRKFTVAVNLSKLGFHWYTFAFQVRKFDKNHDIKIKEFVSRHPFILRAVKTLGAWDFLFYIVARDPKEFHKTIKEIKKTFSDIIKNYDTWVAYKEHYYEPFPSAIGKIGY